MAGQPNSKIFERPNKLYALSPGNYQAIIDGRYFIFMYGRIIYRDIFLDKYFELEFVVKSFLIKDGSGNITSARFEMPQIAGYNYIREIQHP